MARPHPARVVPGLLLAFAGCVGLAASGSAQSVDWAGFADVETVQVLTTDADGGERRTTIWLLVVDGEAYIRTSGTRWGADVERDPEFRLEIEDAVIPVRGAFVRDDATRDRVIRGFREKYGFMDRLTGLIRSSHPSIIRLTAR